MTLANIDLAKAVDIEVLTEYTAAGTSAVNSGEFDLGGGADFDNVLLLVYFGTAAADNTAKVQGTDTTGTGYSDLLGTSVASGSNQLVAIDLKQAQNRFGRVVLARGTSTTVEFIIAIAYHKKSGFEAPASWTTNASYELHISPAAGTA